jgi:3-oxoacyl-[acyl-carrier protein] reductase
MTASDNPFDLEGRVVIVTGGGTGIGKTYSEALCRQGARVVIADIAAKEGEEVAAAIRAENRSAIAVATDVSDEAATQRMAAAAIGEWGRIDGLVNNASLMAALGRKNWMDIPVAEWDRVMAVNLRGIFLCSRAVYPQMKAQGRGKIVNISSSRFFLGAPLRLHYSASKAGVIGFTRSLAREVGGDNICVNAITPGFTESPTQLAGSTADYMAHAKSRYQGRSFKRAQMPTDLVGAVSFLLSSASDFITGQTINVDGGESMH